MAKSGCSRTTAGRRPSRFSLERGRPAVRRTPGERSTSQRFPNGSIDERDALDVELIRGRLITQLHQTAFLADSAQGGGFLFLVRLQFRVSEKLVHVVASLRDAKWADTAEQTAEVGEGSQILATCYNGGGKNREVLR